MEDSRQWTGVETLAADGDDQALGEIGEEAGGLAKAVQ
jgi:hypothetical protein